MNNKTRKIIAWTLSGIVLLLMAGSAIDKIGGSAHSLEMTRSFGITPAIYRLLGIIELASVILLSSQEQACWDCCCYHLTWVAL